MAKTAVVILALLGVIIAERVPRVSSAAGDLKLHRVADDVYFYRGYFSNSAVLVLSDGVLVVDTQVSPRAGRRLRREIEKVTDKPIRWVVNTHYHGDHTGGNEAFPEAEIIASAMTARYVVERDSERVEYANTYGLEFQHVHETVPPTRIFEGRLELELGGETIEILQIGRCETPDACVVRWARRGVVCCGDGVPTVDYPYTGVPFLDEGLRDDGEWVRFLDTIRGWRPHVLLPGHGPSLVGEDAISARLELLSSLFADLMRTTREELARGGTTEEVADRVDARLARYGQNPALRQHTVSQRFACYRCINNLSHDRKGKGWWHDLRPSVIRRASDDAVAAEMAGLAASHALYSRAASLAASNRPLAISMAEAWLATHEDDAAAWALLADLFFDGSRNVRPTVDATEFFVASTKAAKRALALDPDAQLALLNLGSAEVFGGMVLAQDMSSGISKIERALAQGGLTSQQAAKGEFFLGKAHQMELRERESDRHFRRALPAPLRPLYPLLRSTIRAYP